MLVAFASSAAASVVDVVVVLSCEVVVELPSATVVVTVVVALLSVTGVVVALPSAADSFFSSRVVVVVLLSATTSSVLSEQPCNTRATTAIRAAKKATRKDIISAGFQPSDSVQKSVYLFAGRWLAQRRSTKDPPPATRKEQLRRARFYRSPNSNLNLQIRRGNP